MSGMTVPATIAASRPVSRPRRKETDWFLVGLWISLVLLAVLWIAPFFLIVLTSLKSEADIFGAGIFGLPKTLTAANYVQAWQKGNFSGAFVNSLLITVIKVPLGLLISAGGAYALAQMRLRGRETLFTLFLFGTMVPFQVLLAPLFALVHGLGLINTYVGVILPYIAFGVPYQIFVLRSFFRNVPKELSEAAMLDGASHLTIFLRIFLPISLPALAALVILDFVATWNEFAMALVILQDSGKWTLPLGLMGFQGQFASAYGQLTAAITMTVFPACIVYLIFQRYFVGGLTAGAVKE
jgi:raffinose/stachyose/melibiose transport system permease protein